MMLSPSLNELMKPQLSILRVIWVAMTGAVPMYGVLAFAIAPAAPSDGEAPAMLALALTAAALLAGAASLAIARVIPLEAVIRSTLAGDPDLESLTRDPRTGRPDPARKAAAAALPPDEQRLLAVAPLFQVQWVVRMALAEAPAVMGFVLAFLSHDPVRYFPFGAGAFVLTLLTFPRPEPFFERVLGTRG